MENVNVQCRDVWELNKVAKKACTLFLDECRCKGINIFITETYRSQARQNYLYNQGRTAPGNIVTWTKNSRHTSRMAWDIACRDNNLYDTAVLNKAGEVAKALGITWGGTWATKDLPHFEVDSLWEVKMEEKRYNKLGELPLWAQPAIEKLIQEGRFGDENKLDLSLDMVRTFVILGREGIEKTADVGYTS